MLTAVLTATLVLVGVAVLGVTLTLLDGLGRTELLSECTTDPTLSGPQGYCVVVSRYPATPAHSERTYLEIAQVWNGAPVDVRFSAAYPFSVLDAGTDLDIDWSQIEEHIVVTDPDTGSAITYTADQYGTIR